MKGMFLTPKTGGRMNRQKSFETMTSTTIKDEMIGYQIVVGVADGEHSKKLQLILKLAVAKTMEMVRTYENVQQ